MIVATLLGADVDERGERGAYRGLDAPKYTTRGPAEQSTKPHQPVLPADLVVV